MTRLPVFSLMVAFSAIIAMFYFRTLSPSIAGGDSGELVAEGCSLGTAHPPGYPLFTLMTYSITNIIGVGGGDRKAYGVNFSSTIFTSMAAGAIGLIVHSITRQWPDQSKQSGVRGGGLLLSMGLFAFSPLIWQYAVTAEVFPMNTMFAAVIILLVLEFAFQKSQSIAVLGALICGLALCNQHTIVLFEAPCILWMMYLMRRAISSDIVILVKLGVAFLLGLLPYVYLPIAAINKGTGGSWGHVSTFSGFLHHVLRRDYGTFRLFSGATGRNNEGFWKRTEAYILDANNVQGLHITPLLAFVGVLVCVFVTVYTVVQSSRPQPPSSKQKAISKAMRNSQHHAKKIRGKDHATPPVKDVTPPTNYAETTATVSGSMQVDAPAAVEATTSETAATDFSSLISDSETKFTPVVIFLVWIFYFAVFHSMANLPLGDKLLYGVHQRFWMQPNVLLFAWAGVGYDYLFILGEYLAELFLQAIVRLTLSPRNKKNNYNGSSSSSSSNSSGQKPKQPPIGKDTGSSASASGAGINSSNDGLPSSMSIVSKLLLVASSLLACWLVYQQYSKWYSISDQSQATHFKQYATAILESVPQNAILLINYDMQWTSVRYMHVCEGLRPDLTIINLSMMTYAWFKHKRGLFPHLKFPGGYYGSRAALSNVPANEDQFTLFDFISVNIDDHDIYLGGKLSYQEPHLEYFYELVPTGLVRRFVPKDRVDNSTVYGGRLVQAWSTVVSALPRLPDVNKYPEETWEWTIGRDFKDRVMDTSSFFLELAIKGANIDAQPLIDAMYWLETALIMEAPEPPTALLKNAGLAHVHFVQNKLIGKDDDMRNTSMDYFSTTKAIGWPQHYAKIWSTERFMNLWGVFLQRADAKNDAQYDTMKTMYEAALSARKTQIDQAKSASVPDATTGTGGGGGGSSTRGAEAENARKSTPAATAATTATAADAEGATSSSEKSSSSSGRKKRRRSSKSSSADE